MQQAAVFPRRPPLTHPPKTNEEQPQARLEAQGYVPVIHPQKEISSTHLREINSTQLCWMEADSLAQSVEMSAVPWPQLKLCFSDF